MLRVRESEEPRVVLRQSPLTRGQNYATCPYEALPLASGAVALNIAVSPQYQFGDPPGLPPLPYIVHGRIGGHIVYMWPAT